MQILVIREPPEDTDYDDLKAYADTQGQTPEEFVTQIVNKVIKPTSLEDQT